MGGRYLRVGGFAYVWDTESWDSPLLQLNGYAVGGPVDLIAFSHDNARVMLRHSHGLGAARWYDIGGVSEDAATLELPIADGGNHGDLWPLDDMAFTQTITLSPDGLRAAGAEGEVIFLWDTSTGAKIAHFAGHGERILQVAFGPEPGRLVSLSEDGTVGLWNLSAVPDGSLFHVVCALLPDHGLEAVLADYPITIEEPICGEGYDPPLPEWRTTRANAVGQGSSFQR